MEAARKIRTAVAKVSLLRQAVLAKPALQIALSEVKRVQVRRFAGTYADVLADGPYATAARFFLEELYSERDYAERDAQFARIAGAIERLFPAQVADTAVALAQLHALSEELDQTMAVRWLEQEADSRSDGQRYVAAWRSVGRRGDREKQLSVVIGIGRQMAHLTRTPGLRMMLKMMRRPALAAGLGSLQRFLENGFDIFAAMARQGGTEEFLGIIETRETALIKMWFDSDMLACETALARTLGLTPSLG